MAVAGAVRVARTAVQAARGSADAPFRARVAACFAAVAALHLVGLALLLVGLTSGWSAGLALGAAAFAYLRGLVHAFDFDHVSMIDNSTRKFVSDGQHPASVGLAFSAGHATVVLVTGVLVVGGVGAVRGLFDPASPAAGTLGLIGLAVSAAYLLLVAMTNLAAFGQAWRLHRLLRHDPHASVPTNALTPRGPAARVLTAPLRRVRHPRHVYLLGMLFSLGFDTSSQLGVLMLTAGAALAGAPPASLLALPVLFAAAMTLGDQSNGLVMLRLYRAAHRDPARTVGYNLVVTGLGIASALVVVVTAAAALLVQTGAGSRTLNAVAGLDTTFAGYGLVGLFLLVGALAWLLRRR